MDFTVHSSAEYHCQNLQTLGWETTLCNTLSDPGGPCRTVLRINNSYGRLLFDYLQRFIDFDLIDHILEIGGGYGSLMHDFLLCRMVPRVTMIDISPPLLARQMQSLDGFAGDISFRQEDFLDTPQAVLTDAKLAVLNENIGDFPTITDLEAALLRDKNADLSPTLNMIRGFFEKYDLPASQQPLLNVNIGAILALEKLCLARIPFIFVSEHSCEATVPPAYGDLIRIPSADNPECILLKGHKEFTIRFSYLEKIARHFSYRVTRGPVADYIPFALTPRVRSIMKAPAPWRDEDEIIRYFLEDLFKYEYLLLVREEETQINGVAESFAECHRCGKCCLADFNAYVKDEDLQRWRREGRLDILSVIEGEHAIWAGDHLISADTGRYLHGCPFLTWECDGAACSIYETRPAVCRNYVPASSEICPQWQP